MLIQRWVRKQSVKVLVATGAARDVFRLRAHNGGPGIATGSAFFFFFWGGMMSDFRRELTALLNRHGKEQDSDTPDFLLAGFLESSLAAYEAAVIARDRLKGRKVGGGASIAGLASRLPVDLHDINRDVPAGMAVML